MIETLRRMMNSKVGAVVALAFLALIALAFASSDVAGSRNFGGIAGGDRVATVGKARIDTATLSQAASSALENIRQQDPRMSMQAFLAANGLNRVLDDLIGRTAIAEFGRQTGIVASDRLIDSEIAKLPAFQGPDGKFSDAIFRQAMQQRGLNEAMVRDDISQGLIARQAILPASLGASIPGDMARRYVGLLRERRSGAIGVIPAAAFVPATPPTDTELTTFYTANRNRFLRPERRTIRYAEFGEDAVKTAAPPTEAEVAARFAKDKALYSALETRRLIQLVVPTEAAAKAIVAETAKGTSLEAAARSKGLDAAKLDGVARTTLAEQASPAVADAAFAAASGAIAPPTKGGLGWYVIKIDGIDSRPARTLDQVRGEIVAKLTAEKRRAALDDMTARIEEEFDGGGTLGDVAKELGLTLQQTAPVTADGAVYGKTGERVPQTLAPALQAAFAMERENQPQLAVLEAGKRFVLFDVGEITPSAAAPLAEIRKEVEALWMLDRGAVAAKAVAQKVQAAVQKGATLQAAMAGAGKPLPPVQAVNMDRQELARMQQAAPPLTLLFSMARKTVKVLPAADKRGWFVVWLDSIVPQDVKPDDPFMAAAQRELSGIAGNEYAEQLRNAMQQQVGVTRNPAAVQAVRKQLGGGS